MVVQEMYRGLTKTWQAALLVSIVLFSIYTGLNTLSEENLQSIATNTNTTNLYQKGGYFGLWAQSLASITPAWRFNWFEDKYIVGINDIPFPDGTDILGLLIPVLIMIWIFKRYRVHENKFLDIFYKILIVLFVVLILFLLWKHIVYQIYIYSSIKMGLTAEQAIQIREGVLKGMENVTFIMFIISIFTGWAIFKTIKRK